MISEVGAVKEILNLRVENTQILTRGSGIQIHVIR